MKRIWAILSQNGGEGSEVKAPEFIFREYVLRRQEPQQAIECASVAVRLGRELGRCARRVGDLICNP